MEVLGALTIGLGKFEKRDQEQNLQDEGNQDLWLFNATMSGCKVVDLVESSATHKFIKEEVVVEILYNTERGGESLLISFNNINHF